MAGSRYNRRDPFYQRAKTERFAARSVYKLDELNRRFQVVEKNQRVVDFGCAPGSWLQYLATAVGRRGVVVGYDLEPVTVALAPQVRFRTADVHALTPDAIRWDLAQLWSQVRGKPMPEPIPTSFGPHVVLSDMAPKLTGVRDADQARSVALAGQALALAECLLPPEGASRFVAKIFQGRDTDDFVERLKLSFSKVRVIKPEATREGSREAFVVAEGLRREAAADG